MARGLGGLTALRAALGGVAGGLQGLGEMREARRLAEREQQELGRQTLMDEIMLRDKRFRPVEEIEATRTQSGEALSRALSSATAMMAPGAAMSGRAPSLRTGDTELIQQARSFAGPRETIAFGGRQFAREPEDAYQLHLEERKAMSEAQRLEQQQNLLESRQKAAGERANRGYFAVLQRAKALPENVTYEDVQDIDLKPFFDEYKQAKSAEEAMRRANVMAGAQRGMVSNFQTGIDPATGQPKIFGFTRGGEAVSTGVQPAEKSDKDNIMSSLQAMGVTRASSALNLLTTNVDLMAKYEQDLLKRKGNIPWAQLELAREALKGGRGSAAAEAALNEFGGESGRALLRYLRAAKGISGAVREITPRGGSNLMMLMEQTLASIGPAGIDPESIAQVQQFRDDLLLGVREGVQAMRGQRALDQIDQGRTTPQQAREAYSDRAALNDWKRRNPKLANESTEEYARRMQAAIQSLAIIQGRQSGPESPVVTPSGKTSPKQNALGANVKTSLAAEIETLKKQYSGVTQKQVNTEWEEIVLNPDIAIKKHGMYPEVVNNTRNWLWKTYEEVRAQYPNISESDARFVAFCRALNVRDSR